MPAPGPLCRIALSFTVGVHGGDHPPHAHVQVATAVLRAGSHLLLETPPVLGLDAFETLSNLAADAGLACQTGFQSFGSSALPVLGAAIAAGKLGDIIGVGAAGAWI